MKTKRILLIASACLGVAGIVSGFGVTYAGFAAKTSLPSEANVGISAATRLIYLKTDYNLGSNTWALDDPTFWVVAYDAQDHGTWVRGAQVTEHVKYRFRVNTDAIKFVFARANKNIAEPTYSNIWTQTEDVLLSSSSGAGYRTFEIRTWSEGYGGHSSGAWIANS